MNIIHWQITLKTQKNFIKNVYRISKVSSFKMNVSIYFIQQRLGSEKYCEHKYFFLQGFFSLRKKFYLNNVYIYQDFIAIKQIIENDNGKSNLSMMFK